MRFLTIPETLPRRNVTEWSSSWLGRADALSAVRVITPDLRIEIFRVYNEGTLLLHRLRRHDLAAAACTAVLELRRSEHANDIAAFAVQRWLNLARLDL